MKNAIRTCVFIAAIFGRTSLMYPEDAPLLSAAPKPGPNATKEQWMQYYDQVLGRTPTPPASPAKDTTNFPSCVEIVSRLFKESWAKVLQPIPSTVIDKGILRNVPYSSYKTGDYEMNVYGDLQNPAGVEIGIYRSLLNNDAAKQHCIEFMSSVLPSQKHRDILKH